MHVLVYFLSDLVYLLEVLEGLGGNPESVHPIIDGVAEVGQEMEVL